MSQSIVEVPTRRWPAKRIIVALALVALIGVSEGVKYGEETDDPLANAASVFGASLIPIALAFGTTVRKWRGWKGYYVAVLFAAAFSGGVAGDTLASAIQRQEQEKIGAILTSTKEAIRKDMILSKVEIEKTGAFDVLEPESLISVQHLDAGIASIDAARRITDGSESKFISQIETARISVNRASIRSVTKSRATADLAALVKPGAEFPSAFKLRRDVLKSYMDILLFLKSTRGNWRVEDGIVVMSREKDIAQFDAYVDAVTKIVDRADRQGKMSGPP